MRIWPVSFHTIENEWTDDQFFAMMERAGERAKKENKQLRKNTNRGGASGGGGVSTRRRNYGITELAATAVKEKGGR